MNGHKGLHHLVFAGGPHARCRRPGRIKAQPACQGIVANHKAVPRIMREESCLLVVRRYVHATCSGHGLSRFPNLIQGLATGPAGTSANGVML